MRTISSSLLPESWSLRPLKRILGATGKENHMDNTLILNEKRGWKNRNKNNSLHNEVNNVEYQAMIEHEERLILPSSMLIGSILLAVVLLLCSASTGHANSRIVDIARKEIGKGEQFKNNYGKDVFKYTNGKQLPWCAAFVSWTLHKAGKNTPYTLSAKNYLNIGKRVSKPKPGDLIVFNRKNGGHIGIVESVEQEIITTIQGNTGDYPAKVKRIKYKQNEIPNLIAFVRV